MSIHTSQTSPGQPTHSPEPKRSSATKPVMVLFSVLGGLILLAVAASTIFSSVLNFNRGSATVTAETSGISGVNVEANASQFNLEFGEVSEATLETSGLNADGWRLTRDRNELYVEAPNQWLSWCFFNCNFGDNQVSLVLPEELNDGSLNANIDLAAGNIEATGTFDELGLELGAGKATINGSAQQLDAELNAGSADLQLADVQTADLSVSAGRLNTELTGRPPGNVDLGVNAGRLDLTLPDNTYSVNSEVSAGNLDNQLRTDAASEFGINVDLSAGNATLRPGE